MQFKKILKEINLKIIPKWTQEIKVLKDSRLYIPTFEMRGPSFDALVLLMEQKAFIVFQILFAVHFPKLTSLLQSYSHCSTLWSHGN